MAKKKETKKQETKKQTKKKEEPELRSSEELGDMLSEAMSEFKENHDKWANKNVAQAAKRARAYLGEIRGLVTEYRKATIQEVKEMKEED